MIVILEKLLSFSKLAGVYAPPVPFRSDADGGVKHFMIYDESDVVTRYILLIQDGIYSDDV